MLLHEEITSQTATDLAETRSIEELKALKECVTEAHVKKLYKEFLDLSSAYAASFAALRSAFESIGLSMEEGLEMKPDQFAQRLRCFVESEKDQSKMPSRSVVPKKYQHPSNPALAWSGRGVQPVWMNEYLAAHPELTRESLRIKSPLAH